MCNNDGPVRYSLKCEGIFQMNKNDINYGRCSLEDMNNTLMDDILK